MKKVQQNKFESLMAKAKEIGEISYWEAMERTMQYVQEEFERQEKYFEGASGIVVDFKLRVLDKKGEIHRVHPRHFKEYSIWRTTVFTRDNFTCQHCGRKRELQAHHIEQYALNADKQLDVDNGLTLCKTCHNKIPRQRVPKV